MVRFTEALRRGPGVVGRRAGGVARARRRRPPACGVPGVARRGRCARRRAPAGSGGGGPRPAGRRTPPILGAVLGLRETTPVGRCSCPCPPSATSSWPTSRAWSGRGVPPRSGGGGAAPLGDRDPGGAGPVPEEPEQIEAEVLRCVRMLGLPDPVDVGSAEPLLPGAARLRPGDLPRQVQGRPFRHVAVTSTGGGRAAAAGRGPLPGGRAARPGRGTARCHAQGPAHAADFTAFYRAVHHHDPFPWQSDVVTRCYGPTLAGPGRCAHRAGEDLPVGRGRFRRGRNGGDPAGSQLGRRRCFFVVDRRIVVDEATDHARAPCSNDHGAPTGRDPGCSAGRGRSADYSPDGRR